MYCARTSARARVPHPSRTRTLCPRDTPASRQKRTRLQALCVYLARLVNTQHNACHTYAERPLHTHSTRWAARRARPSVEHAPARRTARASTTDSPITADTPAERCAGPRRACAAGGARSEVVSGRYETCPRAVRGAQKFAAFRSALGVGRTGAAEARRAAARRARAAAVRGRAATCGSRAQTSRFPSISSKITRHSCATRSATPGPIACEAGRARVSSAAARAALTLTAVGRSILAHLKATDGVLDDERPARVSEHSTSAPIRRAPSSLSPRGSSWAARRRRARGVLAAYPARDMRGC